MATNTLSETHDIPDHISPVTNPPPNAPLGTAPATSPLTAKLDDIRTNKRNYWKAEEENILAAWCDRAQCYEWMHYKAHLKYKNNNAWFTIPVIIISTITGTANFAQDRFGDAYKDLVVMGIGSANIIAGIITTIYQFLKISELNEAHRAAALSWGKFCRNIKAELSKHPLDRVNHEHFVSLAKEEYDRLIEISPIVPAYIIKKFNKKYSQTTTFSKPEICAQEFGTHVFDMDDNARLAMVEELLEDKMATEKAKNNEIEELRANLDKTRTQKEEIEAAMRAVSIVEDDKSEHSPTSRDIHLDQFRDTFIKINGRLPNEKEIDTMFTPIYGSGRKELRRETIINFNDLDILETNI